MGYEDGARMVGSTPASSSQQQQQYRTSRQSVMGGAGAPMGGNARASMMSSGGGGGGVTATPNNANRRSTMAQNSRQSIAPGARQSLAPGAFQPPPPVRPPANIDPRPLRSREFISEMKMRVHEYAERTGFGHAGYRGLTSLDSPTQSIFLSLFRHIFNSAIDPSYAFQLDAKKPEEEVMAILQEYRYPALGDVTKMHLGSASSLQYWPRTLAILDWMVGLSRFASDVPSGPLDRERVHGEMVADLVRMHAQATSALHSAPASERAEYQRQLDKVSADLREAEHGLGGEEGPADPDRWFYPFLWRCYERFWEGEDAYPDEMAQLEEDFEKQNASVRAEIERLAAEKSALQSEVEELTSGDSDLVKAQKANDLCRSDLKKFKTYRDEALVPRIDKLKLTISRLEESRAESTAELEKLQGQHESLSRQVSLQEMSSEEFDRLSGERAALTAEKERQEADIKEHENQRYKLELENSNMQQQLEEKLKVFNPLGAKVGLFPLKVRRADGAAPGAEELLEEIDLYLGNRSLLHPGLDLKGDLRARVADLRRKVDKAQRRAIEEKVERQEKYDEVCERLHQVNEQETEVRGRLEVIKESIEEITRLTDEETRAANDEQFQKDRKLENVHQAGHRQLAEVETRLVELRGHQRRLGTLARESLEKYKDELCAAVEECVGLKARVGECIEEVGLRVGVEFADGDDGEGGEEGGEEDVEMAVAGAEDEE